MNNINNSMMFYDNSRIEQLKASAAGNKFTPANKELYNACSEFETIFIKQMLDSMRKTVEKTSLSESATDTTGMNYFEDMLYDDYAKKMAKTANLGIAKMMYMQLYKSTSGQGDF
ncbi:MAG: rod-binding protein [Spirochaetia bacterium]|nr:rod-binding protein [Spirochaetia bacterium]